MSNLLLNIEATATVSIAEAGLSVTEHNEVGLVVDAGGDEQVSDGAVEDDDRRQGELGDIETDLSSDDMLAELRSEDRQDVEPAGTWQRYQRLLPAPVRDLLKSCLRRDDLRARVLGRLHEEFLLRDVDQDLHDAATIKDAWRAACTPGRLRDTLRLVREVRDELVRTLHLSGAYQHATYSKVPTFLRAWKPEKCVLKVAEVGRTVPSFGWSAFLEQTPPVVVRNVYERWLARTLNAVDASALLGRRVTALDLTGGSGTVPDVLGLFSVQTRSYDLSSANEVVATLDARSFKRHFETRTRYSLSEPHPRGFARPDLVFVDPPSRGTPTHTEIYGLGEHRELDLGGLDRASWVEAVTGVVAGVLPYVAHGGVISLVVRAGVRDRGHFEPDLRLVDDVKTALGSNVSVIEELTVEYGVNRVRQASLSTTRVPATHLLLGRPA